MQEICIWCDKKNTGSVEHILPESLGCPSEFILRKGVCQKCNNGFSRLDRALLTPFEIITFIKQIPRKRGKLPTVDGFRTFSSGYDTDGPIMFMNREKHSITMPGGQTLKGTTKLDPIKNAKWEWQLDGQVKSSFQQELRFDRKAVRCLFKIALESIAYFEGLETARDKRFDDVRHFVMKGGGNFRAVLMPDKNDQYQSYFGPRFVQAGQKDCIGMTILGVGFVCDFDPKFEGGTAVVRESKKQNICAQVIPNWPRDQWTKNNGKFS